MRLLSRMNNGAAHSHSWGWAADVSEVSRVLVHEVSRRAVVVVYPRAIRQLAPIATSVRRANRHEAEEEEASRERTSDAPARTAPIRFQPILCTGGATGRSK